MDTVNESCCSFAFKALEMLQVCMNNLGKTVRLGYKILYCTVVIQIVKYCGAVISFPLYPPLSNVGINAVLESQHLLQNLEMLMPITPGI